MNLWSTFLTLATLTLLLSHCNSPEKNDSETLSEADSLAYDQKGRTIAAATFAQMSARLAAALEEGGVPYAVQYCNTAALPLTDSLSAAHQATIRRTSLKVRNPKNRPSTWEAELLAFYQTRAKAGEPLNPLVKKVDAKTIAFAAPIKVLPLCLNCHGIPGETMKTEDHALIKSLYPDDAAFNYTEGDLRGMWSITFPAEKRGPGGG